MNTGDLPLTVSTFARGKEDGPAYGRHWHTTWGEFSATLQRRREGEKDGPCFAGATFTEQPVGSSDVAALPDGGFYVEPDGDPDLEKIRRLKANVTARTVIALDIETNKKTGELPPPLPETIGLAQGRGWACVGYTSHNHQPDRDTRYRLILPITTALEGDPPAPKVVADRLGLLGVLDTSKIGAGSLFYFPSAPPGRMDQHQAITVDGAPLDASGLLQASDRLQATRAAEAEQKAAAAHAEAAARRADRLAAGVDPDDSLIEKLRPRFGLTEVLEAHGYDRAGTKFRHPNSSSGMHGADIKLLGGIERVFSHNASDPLHADNLPEWCGTVTALDVVDVVAILDFGGDRRRALRELAAKHGLNKAAERKEVARLMFRLIRRCAAQATIEAAAYAEGARLGLSRQEVIHVAKWVADQGDQKQRAA